jgi:hypothetical protein
LLRLFLTLAAADPIVGRHPQVSLQLLFQVCFALLPPPE